MNELIRQVVSQIKGSWRFRWSALLVAWLLCIIGWAAVYLLPDSFESSATLYVDTTSTLEPLLETMTIESDVLSRVELVTKAVLGRPLLERVARETDLHLRAETPEDLDRLIVDMRSRVALRNDPRRDPNVWTIGFRDENPATAQSVVSSILNIFIEDSLSESRVDTEQAQEFLRKELSKLEEELERAERELANFKKENVGLMPGESGGYFERLQSSMDSLDETKSELRLAYRKREALVQQLAGERPLLESTDLPQSDLDLRISDYQSQLEALQLRFTDRHPDVIAMKQTLDELREQKQNQLDELSQSDGIGVASDNPVFQNIQIELTAVSVDIETLLEKESTQEKRIDDLRALIDVLPEVEAELSRLTRDYDVHQAQYQDLLQRLEVAELSQSAEQSEDVQFRVIDPPLLPEDPVAPNRPFLLFGVLVAGLAAGGGLAFLRNQVEPVFYDLSELRVITGLPVLGTVSRLDLQQGLKPIRVQLLVFGIALVCLCAAFVGAVALQNIGGPAIRSLI